MHMTIIPTQWVITLLFDIKAAIDLHIMEIGQDGFPNEQTEEADAIHNATYIQGFTRNGAFYVAHDGEPTFGHMDIGQDDPGDVPSDMWGAYDRWIIKRTVTDEESFGLDQV